MASIIRLASYARTGTIILQVLALIGTIAEQFDNSRGSETETETNDSN